MLYRNKKNGKIYFVLSESIIDATNGRETEEPMVLYTNEDNFFVRKQSEFFEKFEKVSQ